MYKFPAPEEWNLPNSPPPLLPSSETSVHKVEIHDAYDIKRWYWKANDGIEIKLPAINVRPTHNGLFPMNIRVKDPLWQMRDMADFSFSVRPGDSPVLWIDTRDRILPKERALYITVAGAGADLTLWDIKPGKWRVRQGIDTDDDQKPDNDVTESVVYLERGEPVSLRQCAARSGM